MAYARRRRRDELARFPRFTRFACILAWVTTGTRNFTLHTKIREGERVHSDNEHLSQLQRIRFVVIRQLVTHRELNGINDIVLIVCLCNSDQSRRARGIQYERSHSVRIFAHIVSRLTKLQNIQIVVSTS